MPFPQTLAVSLFSSLARWPWRLHQGSGGEVTAAHEPLTHHWSRAFSPFCLCGHGFYHGVVAGMRYATRDVWLHEPERFVREGVVGGGAGFRHQSSPLRPPATLLIRQLVVRQARGSDMLPIMPALRIWWHEHEITLLGNRHLIVELDQRGVVLWGFSPRGLREGQDDWWGWEWDWNLLAYGAIQKSGVWFPLRQFVRLFFKNHIIYLYE